MTKSYAVLSLLVIGVAACSSNSATTSTPTPAVVVAPAPRVLDPVGAYEFSTVAQGQAVTGTLTIAGVAGAYNGKVVTNIFPEIPVTAATVKGDTIDVKASMPDGELAIRMVMDAATSTFKGNWALGSDSGDFNGKKLPKQ